MIAQIIINSNARALNRIFDYIVPKELEKDIKIGARVFVPFGNSKKLEDGFVIGLKEKSDFANKPIEKIIKENYLDEQKVNLAKLMAKKYFCNISDCIKLMLPPGTASKELKNRVKEKTGNFVYLNKTKEEIEFDIQIGKIKSEKHIRTLKFLMEDNEGIYKTDLEQITDVSNSILNTMAKNGYIQIIEENIKRNPFKNKNIEKDFNKKLNEEQEKCYLEILDSINKNEFSNNLIFGVTGSRKNRNLFTINRESIRKRKKSNSFSSRNFFNTTNGR